MASSSPPVTPPFPPALALLGGVLAIATGAIFARLAEAPSLVIAAYRVGLATLLVAPWACWWGWHELRRLRRCDYVLVGSAGLFLALHFATWIASLQYTSVASSVVLVNLHPLWVGLATPFVSTERLPRTMYLSIALSVLGGVLIGVESLTTGSQALWGNTLAVLGGVCAAGYLLLGRQVRRHLTLLTYILLCYGSAAVFLWAWVGLTRQPAWGFSVPTYQAFVALAIVPQLLGHSSYNWALRWLSPSMIAVSLLGEPVGSAVLAYLIFGEALTWATFLGGGCILGAIALAARSEG